MNTNNIGNGVASHTDQCSGTPGCDPPSGVILVVEDDLALLKLIQKRLGEQGFHTEGVADGASAVRWLKEHSAQLMLLDYSLPDMQGEELLEQLEAHGMKVPFVIATGHGSETVAVEMMRRGARDYMIKGASFLKLLPTVVRQTLVRLDQERRLAEAEEQLRVGRRQAELTDTAGPGTAGETLAELADELSQPLAAISSYVRQCTRLLQSGHPQKADEVLASMQQIGEQADRAAKIIRRLRLRFDLPTHHGDAAGEPR